MVQKHYNFLQPVFAMLNIGLKTEINKQHSFPLPDEPRLSANKKGQPQ
jgi:hypothetical protein